MKKILNFAKKKKSSSGTPDNASRSSLCYDLKEKDLSKVHKAALGGDLAKLKQLAAKQKNDLNQLDKENRTPLHIACAAGHVDVVQFLVESKAKLNLCDNQNRSPLMIAVQGQHENCVNVLLENHADPNLVDINGNTALHLAANIPSVSTAGLLLEHETNINAPNKGGLTPLGVSVREDHIEMAEFLLKEGADINATDNDKRSTLMMAAGNGQIAMLRLLLRNEADITLKDEKGWSADDYAVMNGHHPCSLLIIEHGTQKSDGSSSHQDQGKRKKKMSAPCPPAGVGFSLGGPAIDKDDFEDNSSSESLSRVSKSGVDDWASSDDDEESPTVQKKSKRFSLNLREMIAAKTGASVQLDSSEPEPETPPHTAPSLPKTAPSSSAPLRPVDPSPESLSFKPPRMTSTPLSSFRKKELSSEDSDQMGDVGNVEDEEEEEEEEEEQEEDESEHSVDAASTIPETDTSKDKRRDFMSELGLEKEEPEQDSGDSEEDSNLLHEKKESKIANEETVKEENEEINRSNVPDDGDKIDQGESSHKETEKRKWGPLLNIGEAKADQNTDLMEELGLGDVDDLEDASDWDSASTVSKHTLPGGRRKPSSGIEEFPESPEPPKEKPKPAAPVTPQQSFNSSSHSSPSRPAPPHPQPRVRKTTPRKSHSQEDSDCDSEQQMDNPVMEALYRQVLDDPDSPEPKAATESAESEPEAQGEPVERDSDAVDVGELAIDAPHSSGHPIDENINTLRDQDYYEDHTETTDTSQWETRYEKLWVEVEKREVQTSYKSVTAELKARFGEVKLRQSDTEEEEEEEEDISEHAPEMSSDEDEGDVIVRPMARARQTVRLSAILEQRESGLEDSGSAETSVCERECEEDPRLDQTPEPEQDVPCEEEEEEHSPPPSPQPQQIKNTNEDGSFPRLVSQDKGECVQSRPPSPDDDASSSLTNAPDQLRTSSPPPSEVNTLEDATKQDFKVDSCIPNEAFEEVCTESDRIPMNKTSNATEVTAAASSLINNPEEHGADAITYDGVSSQDATINRRSSLTPEEGFNSDAFTTGINPNINTESGNLDEKGEKEFSLEPELVSQEDPRKTSLPPPAEATDVNNAFPASPDFEDDSIEPLDDKVDDDNESCKEEQTDSVEPRVPCPLSRRSVSVSGVSDEELEEDMERFKMEVGMLKVVFQDLEREKAQLQKEALKLSTVGPTDEEQGPPSSRGHSGKAPEDVGSEKPEIGSREEPSTPAAPREHKPVASKRANGQQRNSSSRKDTQESTQQEAFRSTHRHVNGNPLSVFDDSSLSDVSDADRRMPIKEKKNENSEEAEMAEDFDDLTQSSDTATDELDSPSAGYRHAALLVEKLDSTSLDSRNMVKLQNIFHEYERTIQKLKSRHSYLSDKVNQLEMEKVDMKNSLEEIKDVKPMLERNQLELQTEVTNLKFQLKQEQENRRNATMMYNTTKDKLKRTEEQHQTEIQDKQKVELTLRNLELEMRTLVNNIKQLEEDHSSTQRLLVQERSARGLQEDLLNNHLRKQQEIEEENRRNISKSNQALSQLTEASDREKELLQQTTTLQEQISILRGDLERSQANSSLKESHLLEENETLKEQLEDVRREVKTNSEALTQTVFNCNNQLTTLKSELAIMTNRFENEKQGREGLEREVDSTRTRLTGAVQEAERCMAANADSEKALLREKEESQRLKDRLTAESGSHRDAVSSLSQKLSKAESDANNFENEVHRVTLQLTEKGLLLDVLQKEKEQLVAQVRELDKTLQNHKDLVTKTGARHEATQERLAQAQSEGMLLRQQLEEANNKGEVKEKAVSDAQKSFSDMLSDLRSDCEERVTLVEERNKELGSKAADLRDQVFKLEEEKNEREASLRQLQQELADSLKRLSMSEASLEVNTRYRSDLEEEKARTLKDLDRLKEKLAQSEDQYVQAEKRFNSLKSSFDDKEKEFAITAQRLQEVLSSASASAATIKQLEEAVQRLEIENAKLEATAKQQSNKIEALQKGAQEGAMVRGHLEELVTNLQSSKMSLEDQLSREVQKQSMLSHTAQDSQALWEQEVKSRSKLGLRLSELEKEKGDLTSQMEIEKKKAKKISEQKKSVDARLEQELNRNSELQKEMYRLRTLLKTAKKKLRDQDVGGDFNSPMNSLRMDMGRLGQDTRKAEDLAAQLERETSRRSQLEKDNTELREELSSLKRSGQNGQKVQEELLELRRHMESSQSQAEERARHELQHKLEQVNLFLQTQAASQEALDQIKATNQASLRSQLEKRIRELEGELSQARSTQRDSLSQRESSRTELDRYMSMYTEEMRLRKSLASKLERANTRLSDANSKLLSERSRSLISGSLDGGTLGSSGGNLGLSRSLGLSLLSPVSAGQGSRVEDYLTKMQSELDRNISKELNSASAELGLASARLSPVGSASLDPLSRATQQYLEVLKKNYSV